MAAKQAGVVRIDAADADAVLEALSQWVDNPVMRFAVLEKTSVGTFIRFSYSPPDLVDAGRD